MNFKLLMAIVATRFIVMQQEKARKLLVKKIVFNVMCWRFLVMNLSRKRGLRKVAALRSKAVQANKAISASEWSRANDQRKPSKQRTSGEMCIGDNMEIAVDWHKARESIWKRIGTDGRIRTMCVWDKIVD